MQLTAHLFPPKPLGGTFIYGVHKMSVADVLAVAYRPKEESPFYLAALIPIRGNAQAALGHVLDRFPRATEDAQRTAPLVNALSQGEPVNIALLGTPFQQAVWMHLLALPPHTTTSYSAIAEAIGHPTAMRAVGTAVGRNPFYYIIPCHRVLSKDGSLGGYAYSLEEKRRLLKKDGLLPNEIYFSS